MSIRGLGLGVSGIVPGFGVSPLLRLARTAVLLTLFATSLLAMTSSASADECPNEALREAQHSTFLPDCRAYEMVSPPDKNGGDVMADNTRIQAAVDGEAISFASRVGFGDVHATHVVGEYIAERSALAAPGDSGWRTHGISPRQEPTPFFIDVQAEEPRYEGDFSPDLTKGVFVAWSPLTDEPETANVFNLYSRSDLRTAGEGSYELLTPCPGCEGSPIPFHAFGFRSILAGTSSDFSHVLFQSRYKLTPDAPGGGPQLYETIDGRLRYAGILPDGTPTVAVGGGGAGETGDLAEAHFVNHAISTDGSRVIFTAPQGESGEFTQTAEHAGGNIYQRDDHNTPSTTDDTTVQVNTSERTDCADHIPCTGKPEPDPNGPAPAAYSDASSDGSRIFFITAEQLNDADHNSTPDLYMYDTTAPVGHHLTLLSPEKSGLGAGVLGVVGVSTDGRYVYFLAQQGEYVAGHPESEDAIYLWHGGAISLVGVVRDGEYQNDLVLSKNPAARVTPDGNHVLWESQTDSLEIGYDSTSQCVRGANCTNLFWYTAATGRAVCVSCASDGAPAKVDATDASSAGEAGAPRNLHLTRPLTSDGRYVFFSTAEGLVPQDRNGLSDAYEYDTKTREVHLLSSGQDDAESWFEEAAPDGDDVFIMTKQALVGWDLDENYDLYDVRVDGGFPEPTTAAVCGQESCQGVPTIPPTGSPPASAGYVGAGNSSVPLGATSHGPGGTTPSKQLHIALKRCRALAKHQRRLACEKRARRRFPVHATARSSR